VGGLASAILTARLLGPDGRGLLTLYTFAVLALAAGFGLGLPTGSYDVTARGTVLPSAVRRAVAYASVAAGLLAGVIALIVIPILEPGIELVTRTLVALSVALGVAGSLASQAYALVLIAGGSAWRAAVVQSLSSFLWPFAFAVVLLVFHAGVVGAMLVVAVVWLGTAAIGNQFVADGDRQRVKPAVATVLRRGIRTVGSDLASILSYRVDTAIVASITGTAALGKYSLGVQLFEPLWLVATALAMGLLKLSVEDSHHASIHAAAAVRMSTIVCGIGGVIGTLGVLLVGNQVFGPGFETVPLVMAWLLPGTIAIGVSKVLSAAVIGRGGLVAGSVIAPIVVVANVALDIALVPGLTEVGAAIASSGAYIVSAALWLVAARRHGLAVTDLMPRPADMLAIRALVRPAPLDDRAA
jgi:O-antigen/teichoic acid export membrane protein